VLSLPDEEESFDDGELASPDGLPVTEEVDGCLGPDSPGVGPWQYDFYD
jgi:hypothetical protein